jgi:PilZ domain
MGMKQQFPTTFTDDTPERRVENRQQISVLINAGVTAGGQDALCRIRNMSDQGVMIECRLPLVAEQPVQLCLRSGRVFDGVVRWARDGRAGIEIGSGLSLSILNEAMKLLDFAFKGARPCFARSGRALVSFDHRNIRCQISEISLNHVRLSGLDGVPNQQIATVTIDGLGSLYAKLGAAPTDGAFGDDPDSMIALFTQPLHFRLLDDWLDATSDSMPLVSGTSPIATSRDLRQSEL